MEQLSLLSSISGARGNTKKEAVRIKSVRLTNTDLTCPKDIGFFNIQDFSTKLHCYEYSKNRILSQNNKFKILKNLIRLEKWFRHVYKKIPTIDDFDHPEEYSGAISEWYNQVVTQLNDRVSNYCDLRYRQLLINHFKHDVNNSPNDLNNFSKMSDYVKSVKKIVDQSSDQINEKYLSDGYDYVK